MKKRDYKRILIFDVNWLGDVLFSTAAIRNIRHNYPESFIACVIPSRCYPVLKDNPYLDEIIIFDDKDRHKRMSEKFRFVQTLKAKKFDVAFLLHRSLTRALLCRLSDIPQRIGYKTKKRGFLLTQGIEPPDPDTLHRIDYYLNVVKEAGLKIEDRHLEFFFTDKDMIAADEFLKKNSVHRGDTLIGINPGGNWMPKRWPQEFWVILADRLISEFGARVVITGSHKDIPLAAAIKESMKQEPLIAVGKLNLKEFGALCRRLDLFISADTGPLHIANAVGTKAIIALFGPTDPAITGPYPLKNVAVISKPPSACKIPCYIVRCKDNRCMKAISPDDVLEEAKRLKIKA